MGCLGIIYAGLILWRKFATIALNLVLLDFFFAVYELYFLFLKS
jgi:hypothetical protein